MLPSVNKYYSYLTYGWGIIHTNTAVVYYLMRGSWKKLETCSNSPSHWPGTFLACEQALLFGQAKRASQERFAARSRVLARLVSLAQKGELDRRLGHFRERENHYLLSANITMRSLQTISTKVMALLMMTKCSQCLTMSHKRRLLVIDSRRGKT